jgi:hypothetical protein
VYQASRGGVYYVDRLIEKHGRKSNMMKWKELLRRAQQQAMP